ncbi:MAG: hypothetical protein ACR2IF_14435 [Terriglobales bacterium]
MTWKSCLRMSWAGIVIVAALAALNACSRGNQQESSAGGSAADASISGTITVAPELKDKVGSAPLLLIMASESSDPKRAALVVKREADVTFPYKYKLTAEDITMVGSSFRGKLYVSARIDPAGAVGAPRPGTFGGSYAGNPAAVGSSNVDVVINKTF